MLSSMLFIAIISIYTVSSSDGSELVETNEKTVFKKCYNSEGCAIKCNHYRDQSTGVNKMEKLPIKAGVEVSCMYLPGNDRCRMEHPDTKNWWWCSRKQFMVYLTYAVSPDGKEEFIDNIDDRAKKIAEEYGISVDQVKIKHVDVSNTDRRRQLSATSVKTSERRNLHEEYPSKTPSMSPTTMHPTPGSLETSTAIAIDADEEEDGFYINGQLVTADDINNLQSEEVLYSGPDDRAYATYLGTSLEDPFADGRTFTREYSNDEDFISIDDDRIDPPPQNPITPAPSSFGDPIVWTFDGLCYDLNQDGHYLASSHKTRYDHDVWISVYNHYMRQIEVTDKVTGEIILSINNFGDVINKYPYFYEAEVKKCEFDDECDFFYKQYTFDAQEFEYVVQIQPHSYDDPALQDGTSGIHIDIFPQPFPGFKFDDYQGLYFQNPIPEESGTCSS